MAPILQKPCLVREVDLYVWQKHSRKSQELSQACWLGYYEMGRGSRKLKELLGRWGKISEGAPSHVEGTESLHGTWGKKYPDNGVSVWEMRTFPVWDISLLEGFHCMIRKMTRQKEHLLIQLRSILWRIMPEALFGPSYERFWDPKTEP